MTENAQSADVAVDSDNVHRLMARAFTALRIFTGLVWISNALAKIFDVGNYDWGFFSFNLITLDAARGIATDASAKTYIAPLGALYRDVVLPHWGAFGAFLAAAEFGIGLGLLFGVATRLAKAGSPSTTSPWTRTPPPWAARPVTPVRSARAGGSASARCVAGARCVSDAPSPRPAAKLFCTNGIKSCVRPAPSGAADPAVPQKYRRYRPNVERVVSQIASRGGRRLKLRYRGTAKNHAWLTRRTAGLNLRNLIGRGLTHTAGVWVLAPATT
jgi:uncharacterized membrane protein YphA (DoxX/SURF4 family)